MLFRSGSEDLSTNGNNDTGAAVAVFDQKSGGYQSPSVIVIGEGVTLVTKETNDAENQAPKVWVIHPKNETGNTTLTVGGVTIDWANNESSDYQLLQYEKKQDTSTGGGQGETETGDSQDSKGEN